MIVLNHSAQEERTSLSGGLLGAALRVANIFKECLGVLGRYENMLTGAVVYLDTIDGKSWRRQQ